MGAQPVKKNGSPPSGLPFRLSKKSKDFSDSLQKCHYFCAAVRRKSPRFARRNPCTARLPGHLIPFEAGGCPLELPRPVSGGFDSAQVFRHDESPHGSSVRAFGVPGEVMGAQPVKKNGSPPSGLPFRLSKKSKDFSDSLQKCHYFCAAVRRKSPRFARRNPCTARLPGHLIPFEAGGCPLELPRPVSGGFDSAQVFRHDESPHGSSVRAFGMPGKAMCAAGK